MQRSTERILTTHVGSLPRPPDLLEMINAKKEGRPFGRYEQRASGDGSGSILTGGGGTLLTFL
jgi:5-methyltetrahydropteroyltriglutamate--homocysteine methyltransferase